MSVNEIHHGLDRALRSFVSGVHGQDMIAIRIGLALACTDLSLLDRWFRRAATAHSVEETFAP